MAVNSITFGNINSADYGIYISGEGVFDAPKRAVEMVNVPGRSGAIALDQGYYENITVTYPAFNHEGTMADFKQALSDFRNALASQVGYQRLSDSFHPDEYRLAVFDEGLDINPIKYNTASQFDIKFDCKPQRYLTSGETEITVESGDILTNPTQYGSSPLLAIEGYGNINIGGQVITVDNSPLGNVTLLGNQTKQGVDPCVIESSYSTEAMNAGDEEVLTDTAIRLSFNAGSGGRYTALTVTPPSSGSFAFDATVTGIGTRYASVTLTPRANITSTVGTAISEITSGIKVDFTIVQGSSSASGTANYIFKYKKTVDGTTETLTLSVEGGSLTRFTGTLSRGVLVGDSTVSLLGHPTYIDCDLGECYKMEGGEYISLNGKIALGSDLPELASGENEVTFDNTITELKVVPRWWKL